ncbi:MAG: SurA N-terminal domain-containing protein [Pseudomonadota bacterium]
MLQDIRETFIGTTGKIVLGVILLLLAGTGLNYTITPKQFAAKVNGEEIPAVEFDREYRGLVSQFGDQQIPEFFLNQLRDQAVEQVLQTRSVQQHLTDAGYAISDEQVRDFLIQVPGFQIDGRFDQETYQVTLANNGFTPAQYENNLRRVLATQQYLGTLIGTEFVTPAEIREFIELRDEQREIEYAVVSPDAFIDQVTVTDADVTAYFESKPDTYRTPEMVDIDYLTVDSAAARANLAFTEEALSEYFESVAEEYTAPEERRARQILLAIGDDAEASRTEAVALRQRLVAGESFETLASEFSIDGGSARQGGDLGWVRPGDFVGPVEDAVFALEAGELSEVVQSEFGLHILRLDDVRGGGAATLADVREEVEERYRDSLVDDALFDLQARVSDLEFEGATLESIAEQTGLTVASFEGYHERRQQPFGEVAEIRNALFGDGAAENDASTRFVQYDEASVLIRVNERRPAGRQPIENVAGQIRELLTEQAAQAVADERGAQLSSVLSTDPNISFEALVLNTEAEAFEKQLVSRNSSIIPAALAAAVFDAPSDVTTDAPHTGSVAAPGAGFVIYRMTRVVPGDPSALPQQQLDATRNQIAQQRAALQVDALARALRRSADVEIGPILERQTATP